jgi:hypothetical protein
MREKPEKSSEKQLEFEFDTVVVPDGGSEMITKNVIHVQFRPQKSTSLGNSRKDQALVERILLSAQRLKW